jgi:hypothetical protein
MKTAALLLVWLVAAPARAGDGPGLLGLGLGLDVPLAGVMGHVSPRSRAAWGYTLGAGVSWEITPMWVARLAATHGGAVFGTAPITYLNAGTRVQEPASADWSGTLARLGAAYQWLQDGAAWCPYVGLDAAVGRGGYRYRYGASVKKLEPPGAVNAAPPEHLATDWLLGAGARVGVRLQLDTWLSTHSEVAALYVPFGTPSVSGNTESRDVRAAAAAALQLQATFSVRLGW